MYSQYALPHLSIGSAISKFLELGYKESGLTCTSNVYVWFLFLGKLSTESSQDLIKSI